MHPQLAKCRVTPRRLGEDPTKPRRADLPRVPGHVHISAMRLWVSLLGNAVGESFRRLRPGHPDKTNEA